ncbi:MAG: hypothetical protein KAH18_10630, partial [Psychromonas sp.]|nr:hypothetical protein [Psychromonas sp.]
LEDEEIIEQQIMKLQKMDIDIYVLAIIKLLEYNNFSKALLGIDAYIAKKNGLIVFENTQVQALKLELKILEIKLEKLIARKSECEIEISNFNNAYQLNLGELIKAILELRKSILSLQVEAKKQIVENVKKDYYTIKKDVLSLKNKINEIENELDLLDDFSDEFDELYDCYQDLKNELQALEDLLKEKRREAKNAQTEFNKDPINDEFEEAHEDSSDFEDEYEETLAKNIKILDKEELKALKVLYRKACKLCHPDIVAENLKEQAHEVMTELNQAKAQHDIKKVKEILAQLESGGVFVSVSDTVCNIEVLTAKIDEIKNTISTLIAELDEIEQSKTYQEIVDIEDQNDYFDALKENLAAEKEQLESRLQTLNDVA